MLGWLSACSTTAPVPPPAEPEMPAAPPAVEAVEPTEAVEPVPPVSTRISIAAVGDMMIGTDYPENHLPDDDGVGFLAGVAPWLWPADIAFGNLEGVLVDGGEPGKKCSNPGACYLFRDVPDVSFT